MEPFGGDEEGAGAAKWPARVRELAIRFRAETDRASRDRTLSELWTLVNLALQRYVRAVARRAGGLDPEDVRDIAAEKALDIVRRLDQREWDVGPYTPAQVSSFVFTMARNGVVDRMRSKSRELPLPESGEVEVSAGGADASLEGREHAEAILECFSSLTPKARLVWLLRVFYEWPSADIARHPGVATTPAAVDTMLLRCRAHVRECMTAKGLDPSQTPTGAFTALWEVVHRGGGPGPLR